LIHWYYIKHGAEQNLETYTSVIPFDVILNPEPIRRETAHFIKFSKFIKSILSDSDFFTLISDSFFRKTNFSQRTIEDWVYENPGYDLYIVNPNPSLAYLNFNMWQQGEKWHSGLNHVKKVLYQELRIPPKLINRRVNNQVACYASYYFANLEFWESYSEYIEKVYTVIDSNPSLKHKLMERTNHTTPAALFPFLMERILPEFLRSHPHIKFKAFDYSRQQILESAITSRERNFLDRNLEKLNHLDLSIKSQIVHKLVYAMVHYFVYGSEQSWKYKFSKFSLKIIKLR
jgi:hypothetical protein